MKIPTLEESVPIPKEVKLAAELGDLILFVGSGVSRRIDLPSWEQFSMFVLKDLVSQRVLNYKDIQRLKILDPRKILSIAKIYNENLDFAKYFEIDARTDRGIYDTLNSIGCTFVTTNYDLLLEPFVEDSRHEQTTPKRGSRFTSCEELLPYVLDEIGNVVHLHGSIKKSRTMVVTTKDYLNHYDSEHVQDFLDHLFKKKTVVFIGYGLDEVELLEHVLRRGSVERGSKQPKLFSLQGFYSTDKPVYESLYRYYKNSFELELLGFLMDHKEYACLDEIITQWANAIVVQSNTLLRDADAFDEVFDS